MKRTAQVLIAGLAIVGVQMVGGVAFAGTPTCSTELGIENHGQHVVGDYVTGLGHEGEWPMPGQVGQTEGLRKGAELPGGPGAHGHMPNIAPGASFCNEWARNGGIHL